MKVGWVFFIFSVVTGLTGLGLAAAVYPAGAPLPQRTRTDCTAQAAGQAVPKYQGRPCKTRRTDTHAQALDTLHRSASDTRQATRVDRDGGGALEVVECVRN